MRTTGYTFEAYMERLDALVDRYGPHCQNETQIAVLQFVEEIQKTKGEPQPNSDWNERANVRHGYQLDVPCIAAEMMAMMWLAPRGSSLIVKNAYDKPTQVDDEIDFFVGDLSYQCKTVQFKGPTVLIEKKLVKGIADYIFLVDIDDGVGISVPRPVLEQFVNERVSMWDFEQMDAQLFNNEGISSQTF